MIRLLRHFSASRAPIRGWWCCVCCSPSVAQGFGIASMVPLISVAGLGADSTNSTSFASKFVLDALATIGLPPDLEILLSVVVIAVILHKSALTVLAMIYVSIAVADVGQRSARAAGERAYAGALELLHQQTQRHDHQQRRHGVFHSGVLYFMISRYVSNIIQTVIPISSSHLPCRGSWRPFRSSSG